LKRTAALLAHALFAHEVMLRPDRREIDLGDVKRALEGPGRTQRQPDGRWLHWLWVEERGRWMRVIIEPDGETVHNAFWDRNFKP